MNSNPDISEKCRKYLLEVRLSGKAYFTVWGADRTSDEQDKWLTDIDGHILLFVSPEALYTEVLLMDDVFDKTQTQDWALAMAGRNDPYYTVDLDLLNSAKSRPDDLATHYINLGLLEDFAIQADDQQLLSLLGDDIVGCFRDVLADYVVWGKTVPAKIPIDAGELFPLLKILHALLLPKVKVYQQNPLNTK